MMPSTPRLLRHATVTPQAGETNVSPALSVREIVCDNIVGACAWHQVERPQLAAMWGVTTATVSGVWHGTRNVSIEELWTVARAFNIPVERFFTLHGNAFRWIYEDYEVNHHV